MQNAQPVRFFAEKYEKLNKEIGNLNDDSYGFGVYQQIYIDDKQKSINTRFLAVSPLITVVDELGEARYITSSFFKINGE